jgi:excisionase family DNA binding protein
LADYLKIPEVARRLDVSEPTVRRMVKNGKLTSVFIGGAYRVNEKDLEEYLESAKVTPGKAVAPLSLFNDLEEERRLAYVSLLRTLKAYVWRLEGDWTEDPSRIAREARPVFLLVDTLIEEGELARFRRTATPEERAELIQLTRGLEALNDIADKVEKDEQRRRTLTLIQENLSA